MHASAPRAASPPWLLAAFVGVSLVTRGISLFIPILDIDESAHIVGTWEMMRGRLLYTEFVNNKPPLLYVYYLVAQACFGRSLIGVHAFTAVAAIPLTALGVSAFYRHSRRGIVAACTYLVFSAAFIGHDMLASHAEVPMMLAATWALVLLRDEAGASGVLRPFGAGLLFGLAFLCKYQVALWLPGVALLLAWTAFARAGRSGPAPNSFRRAVAAINPAIALATGFAVPPLAAWLWFHARGGAAMLLYWTLETNVAYTANPARASEAVGRLLANLVPFLVVTAPLWWGTWRTVTRSRLRATDFCGTPRDDETYRQRLALVVVLLSVPAVFLGFRFYPHYFVQLYVPLAIAAAPWLESQLLPRVTPAGRVVAGWATGMLVGFSIANAVLYFGPVKVYRERDPVYRRVADRLRADPCATGATMFVWGYAPPFYYYADLPAASRFVVMAQSRLTGYMSGNLTRVRDPGEAHSGIVPEHWDWLMEDLKRNRATFILDTAPAGIYRWNRYPVDDYPRLRDYLADHYELADTIDRVRIYRRRGCEGQVPGGS